MKRKLWISLLGILILLGLLSSSVLAAQAAAAKKLAMPSISIVNVSGGMKITWSKVAGAAGYDVYRSENGSSWKKVKSTTAVSYTDAAAKPGKTYYYTVKAYKTVGGKKVVSACDKTKKMIRLTQPAIKLENAAAGVKITWSKVAGAAGYDVYRSENGSSWKKVKSTTAVSYTDAAAKAGKTYYYTVKAYKTVGGKKVVSACDKTKKMIRLTQPAIKLENAAAGVKITWSKVAGAAGYDVYRSENGSSWKKVKSTTAVSYTDAAAKSGKTYYYTVKAYKTVSGKKVVSSCDKTKKIPYLSEPVIKLANTAGGVKVSWGQVTGAAGYDVYRSVNGKSWTKVKSTTGTACTDVAASFGTSYYYTVKAYQTVDGKKFISSCDKNRKILAKPLPDFKMENVVSGIKVSWGQVTGAAGYDVYRSVNGKSWTKVKSTTGTVCTDTDAAAGKTYYYTVKSYKNINGKKQISECDKTKRIPRLTQPVFTLENANAGVTIRWEAVVGAAGYDVYRSLNGSSWSKVNTTTQEAYTDTTAVNGKLYYYTVKACQTVNGKKVISSCDRTQKILRLTQPAIELENVAGGIKIRWDGVTGAAEYVCRSNDGTNWAEIKTTTETACTDATAASGKTYYYTVKACQTVNGKKVISSCDKTQKILRLTQPAIELENVAGGIKIRWDGVTGAAEYVVCRSNDGTNWVEIKTTTETTCTDATAASGKTYYYTVKARQTVNGKKVISSCDKKSPIVCLAVPTVKAENLKEDVKVSWNQVNGATGYVVYVSLDARNWTKLADTNALNYVDKMKQTGKTYYYRVQAVCTVGNMTYCSDFNAKKIVTNTEILEGDMGIEDSIF